MINPNVRNILYADLERIVRILRCDGMTDADVMEHICFILKSLVSEDF